MYFAYVLPFWMIETATKQRRVHCARCVLLTGDLNVTNVINPWIGIMNDLRLVGWLLSTYFFFGGILLGFWLFTRLLFATCLLFLALVLFGLCWPHLAFAISHAHLVMVFRRMHKNKREHCFCFVFLFCLKHHREYLVWLCSLATQNNWLITAVVTQSARARYLSNTKMSCVLYANCHCVRVTILRIIKIILEKLVRFLVWSCVFSHVRKRTRKHWRAWNVFIDSNRREWIDIEMKTPFSSEPAQFHSAVEFSFCFSGFSLLHWLSLYKISSNDDDDDDDGNALTNKTKNRMNERNIKSKM